MGKPYFEPQDPELEPLPTKEPALEALPTAEPKLEPLPQKGNQRVKRWQKLFNIAVAGTGLQPLLVDGIKGPKTKRALSVVRASGVKNLQEFKHLVQQLKPKSIADLKSLLDQRADQMMGSKTPLPPKPPKLLPVRNTRDIYDRIVNSLQHKFQALNVSDPRFKNLQQAIMSKTRDLYTVRDPRRLEKEISEFVSSISHSDIIKSM